MTSIVANSVLPAKRQELRFDTADGLTLHGELALPESGAPVATIVCVHPLTTHGGSMDSHLFRKAAWRLPALVGLAVLRFNMRGAGSGERASSGKFDDARGEGLDLGAVLAYVQREHLPDPWLVGWSFGTDVILKFGNRSPVNGAVLISPPVRFADSEDLAAWARFGRPLVALVPEYDDYLRPEQAREVLAAIPQARVRDQAGAGHLWVGEASTSFVLNEIVKEIAPLAHPLPTTWEGPMQRWSDL